MTKENKNTKDKAPSEVADTDTGSEDKKSKWSTGAKVGAAVGSAAVAAALIYAGRHKMRKTDDLNSPKPKAGQRYENEPEDEEDASE